MDKQKEKGDTIVLKGDLEADTFSRQWFLLFFAGILIIYILLRINILGVPLERDEGLFGYIGQMLMDGGVPYVDAVDHKPPVVYAIYAFALLFFPPTPSGIHTFLHIYMFATLIVLFLAVRNYAQSTPAGFWAALIFAVFTSLPTIQGFSASTEMFMLLPLSICLLFGVLAAKDNRYIFIFSSGLFGGMACWTKHTGFFFSAFVLFYVVAQGIGRGRFFNSNIQNIVIRFFLWLAGALTVSGIIISFFAMNGALEDLYFWGFKYNFTYTQVMDSGMLFPILSQRIVDILKSSFFIVGAGLFVAIYQIFKKNSQGWFLSGMLFFSWLAVIPGYGYSHYFAQISLGVAFSGGMGIYYLQKLPKDKLNKWFYGSLYALIIICIPVLVHSTYYLSDDPVKITAKYFFGNIFSESLELSQYIEDRTEEDDTIFILGSEAQVLFYSNRRSPTRFVLMYPMMNAAFPGYLDFQKEAWEALEKSKPKYIIQLQVSASFAWDGKAELYLPKKINNLCATEYKKEAVMTVDYPKGQLILKSDLARMDSAIKKSVFPVIIYRRR